MSKERQRKRAQKFKTERVMANVASWLRRRLEWLEARDKLEPEHVERKRLINKMTNWQSHQWSKAGFPQSLEKLVHFANLQRPQAQE